MNLLQRYVSHGIAIGLLVFIMLAFNLSVLAQTSEKRVLRVAFPQVDGMSWTAEDGTHHGMLVDYLNEIAKYTGWEYEYIDTKALEPMLSRNIIKLQITDNHILSKAQSKSKSF